MERFDTTGLNIDTTISKDELRERMESLHLFFQLLGYNFNQEDFFSTIEIKGRKLGKKNKFLFNLVKSLHEEISKTNPNVTFRDIVRMRAYEEFKKILESEFSEVNDIFFPNYIAEEIEKLLKNNDVPFYYAVIVVLNRVKAILTRSNSFEMIDFFADEG